MEVIRIIREEDVGEQFLAPRVYRERVAARAIVFDTDGNIALQHITKDGYHKLPGGGVEEGEDVAAGLARELLEEIGCSVQNRRELAIIEEFRNQQNLHQVSHCFVAELLGGKGVPNPDDGERDSGAEPVWMSLENAIHVLEGDAARVEDYTEKFMNLRDLTFLKEARAVLSK